MFSHRFKYNFQG